MGKEDGVSVNRSEASKGGTKNIDPRLYLSPGHPKAKDDSPAQPSPSEAWQGGLSEQILVNSQGESYIAKSDWMSKLKEDSAKFLQERHGSQLDQSSLDCQYKRGVEILIDKIFGLLQHLMYEFNKVAAGTDLHVSGTISGDVTEITRYNKLREPELRKTFFRARFSTRLYSLILRGKEDSIDVFLLPANLSIALSKGEDEYPPLTTIEVKITETGMMWRLSNSKQPIDSLENLCMWLFSELIQKTKRACLSRPNEVG